jgi:hypothetical protein
MIIKCVPALPRSVLLLEFCAKLANAAQLKLNGKKKRKKKINSDRLIDKWKRERKGEMLPSINQLSVRSGGT